jgi:hypothetical protein
VLGVSAPTVSKWLSRTIKEEKEAKQKKKESSVKVEEISDDDEAEGSYLDFSR